MNRRLEGGWKRIVSDFCAFTIVSILMLDDFGTAFAYAAKRLLGSVPTSLAAPAGLYVYKMLKPRCSVRLLPTTTRSREMPKNLLALLTLSLRHSV